MKPAKCDGCGEEFQTSRLLLDHLKNCVAR